MRKESKKCIRSIFLAVLTAMLFVSCGGGGGGGMVSFQNNSGFHNGGDAGGWGNGHQTSNNGLNGGSINGSLSTKAGTFTPPNDIDWSSIELTITVTSGGTTTTHTLANTETEAIAELLTSLKRGDVVEVTADITMVDDDPRTASSGAVTIGVGDNHISLPTPYKFECSMEMTRNMYEDYGCSDTPADASVSGSQTGIYTVNNASSVIPPDASGTGFIFDHWETVPDGQVYVPGSSRGDVVISPVFKPDYSVAYTDLVDTIVITEQSEFTTLMNTHAAENFSGKEIKLYCNVSTSTGFTNTTDGFQGTFNGQNHRVTESISEDSELYAGLFYVLESGATIQNLTTAGSVTLNTTGGYDVGGIVGNVSGGNIQNCVNMATVLNNNESAPSGGIAGSLTSGSITKCANKGNISSSYYLAGGITGNAETGSSISECYNTANITVNAGVIGANQPHVGGIVGYNYSTPLQHCYNTGHITVTTTATSAFAGGICGNNGAYGSSYQLSYCYSGGNQTVSAGVAFTGHIVGSQNNTSFSYVYCNNSAGSSVTATGTVSDANTALPNAFPSIWVAGSDGRPRLINNPE